MSLSFDLLQTKFSQVIYIALFGNEFGGHSQAKMDAAYSYNSGIAN